MSAAAVAIPNALPYELGVEAKDANNAYQRLMERKRNRGGWAPRPEASFRAHVRYGDAKSRLLTLIEWKTVGNPIPDNRNQWICLTDQQAGDAIGLHHDMVWRAAKDLVKDGVLVAKLVGGRRYYRIDWNGFDSLKAPEKVSRTRKGPLSVVPRRGDSPAQETAEIAAEAPRAAFRVIAANEPMVILPGESKPRRLSEVCKHANSSECGAGKPAKRNFGEIPEKLSNEINNLNETTPNIFGKDFSVSSPEQKANKLWQVVKEGLSRALPPEGYLSWIAPSEGIRLEGEGRDKVLTISVPSPTHREFIKEEYAKDIAKVAVEIEELQCWERFDSIVQIHCEVQQVEQDALDHSKLKASLRSASKIAAPVPDSILNQVLAMLAAPTPTSVLIDTVRQRAARSPIKSWGLLPALTVDAINRHATSAISR
jgi:hypothetical protein